MSITILSAVLNGAILSLVMAAILQLAFRVLRNRFGSASTRYAIWMVALFMTVALPVIYVQIQSGSSARSVTASPPGARSTAVSGQELSTMAPSPLPGGSAPVEGSDSESHWAALSTGVEIPAGPWATWVLGLWAVASAFMLLRLPISYASLYRRKLYARPTALDAKANTWIRRCGSRRQIRVAVSDEIAIPVAIGPMNPVILIPARLIEDLGDQQLEQIGLHEAAHLARWDDAMLLVQRILVAIFALHPIVRWIAARLDVERELACDDAVVASTGQARSYAECLTRVAALASGLAPSPVAACAVETRSVLERRLDMLLDKNRKPRMHLFKMRLAAVVPVLALGIGLTVTVPRWLAFAKPPAGASQGQSTEESTKSEARDDLNRGVNAFKTGDFNLALDYFSRASQLDPSSTVPNLYSAAAYTAMYNPKAAETAGYAYSAIRTLEDVLTREPGNIDAIVGLGIVYQLQGNWRTARDYFVKAGDLKPNAVVFYSIGALDWMLQRKDASTPKEKVDLIEEGLQYLDKALVLNTRYSDAMTYKNLLLREKAALARNEQEQRGITAEADTWFAKALDSQKQNLAAAAPQPTLPSVVGLALRSGAAAAPPPPPPLPPPPRVSAGKFIQDPQAPLRIGSELAQSSLVNRVDPVYPEAARANRIQGTVLLQAMIGKDGMVHDLRVVSGHPLLVESAIEAVKQWRYRPQMLNGQPVEIITTISVNFSFQ